MTLRGAFLYLSHNAALRHWMETSAVTRRLSSRFIAGRTLDEALSVCRKIAGEGIAATLDYLGENVTSLEEAAVCRDMSFRMLRSIKEGGMEPNVSLKLTQFGLDFSPEDACEANVAQLVHSRLDNGRFRACRYGVERVYRRTLALVTRLHAQIRRVRNGDTGLFMRRSEAEIVNLSAERIRIRLCKGAYLEPPSAAFPKKADVDRNYLELARRLLIEGNYPAFATHDEHMIERIERFAANRKIPGDSFEFEMLYGIRRICKGN